MKRASLTVNPLHAFPTPTFIESQISGNSAHLADPPEMNRLHRLDGQPLAAFSHQHVLQSGLFFDGGQGHRLAKGLPVADFHTKPTGGFLRCLGIEVFRGLVELRRVRDRLLRNNLGQSLHPRFGTTGVVEEDQIALFHLVAHEVARLVVTHPIPQRSAPRATLQIFKRKHIRLGFH